MYIYIYIGVLSCAAASPTTLFRRSVRPIHEPLRSYYKSFNELLLHNSHTISNSLVCIISNIT